MRVSPKTLGFASGPSSALGTVWQTGSRLPVSLSSSPVSPQRKSRRGAAESQSLVADSLCVCLGGGALRLNWFYPLINHYPVFHKRSGSSLTREIIISYFISYMCDIRKLWEASFTVIIMVTEMSISQKLFWSHLENWSPEFFQNFPLTLSTVSGKNNRPKWDLALCPVTPETSTADSFVSLRNRENSKSETS